MIVAHHELRAGLKQQQAEATKEALVKVGRRLFAKRGFAGVSAEEIVASARLTRGALYHHFDGKEGLFQSVLVKAFFESDCRTPEQMRMANAFCRYLELVRIIH
jgi:AcrR family transcriptional regulator